MKSAEKKNLPLITVKSVLDGQLIGTMQNESSDGSGAGFVIDGQANLLVGMYGEKGITYQTVDFDNNKLSDPLPGFESSDEESFSEYNVCSFSEEYGLLVKDSIYLYSYDADAENLCLCLSGWTAEWLEIMLIMY